MSKINKEKEIWKRIKDYSRYEISNMGRVRSYTTGSPYILRSKPIVGLYRTVNLCREGGYDAKRIGRLVAEHFIVRGKGDNVINHKDGNKKNDKLSNLEWCTQAYNVEHAVKAGLYPRGERRSKTCHLRKLTKSDVKAILRLKRRGVKQRKIASTFSVKEAAISHILKGRTWGWLTKLE